MKLKAILLAAAFVGSVAQAKSVCIVGGDLLGIAVTCDGEERYTTPAMESPQFTEQFTKVLKAQLDNGYTLINCGFGGYQQCVLVKE